MRTDQGRLFLATAYNLASGAAHHLNRNLKMPGGGLGVLAFPRATFFLLPPGISKRLRKRYDSRKTHTLPFHSRDISTTEILLSQRRAGQPRHANDIGFAKTLQHAGHNIIHTGTHSQAQQLLKFPVS